METIRTQEFNGKKYTFTVMDEEDKGLALFYTPGDESKKLDDLLFVKPKFRSENHEKWYELCIFDEKNNNLHILARIQVDEA